MAYEAALTKAWSELKQLSQDKSHCIRLLADEYSIDLEQQRVLSLACNLPAKTYFSIILLHYLAQKIKGLPATTGEWISFKQLPGGQGYFPSFKKRVIDTILRKYKDQPDALFDLGRRFRAKKAQLADISVVLDVLDNVPILITFWRGDQEFGPEANILFDKNISTIFCTEDIVVLAEIVAHSI